MFHITDDGPKTCSAEHGKCPYAKAGQEHFSNEADAIKFYEANMAESHGKFSSLKSKKSNNLQKRGNQPKAAKILQQFNSPSSEQSFVEIYKSKLSIASESESLHTKKMQRVLNAF